MKLYLLALMLLLLAANVNAVTMRIGDSYYSQGKNISLLSINYPEKQAEVCINGEKKILFFSRPGIIDFKNVSLEVFDSGVSFLKIRIQPEPCENCFCGKECSNLACYGLPLPECNDDVECNDNKTETKDICLKSNCFHKASEEKVESISEVNITKGISKKGSTSFIFITSLILLIIIILIVIYFILHRT
ncbi:hypothetical protein HY498_04175 [Candidatus Woesearchaeota archaeon]|nr:hypothetical protein [Candidatus Woesearchaeota archaeon]